MSVQLSPRLSLITVFLRCSAQVSLESGASISFYSLSFILISSVEALHHQTLKDKLLLCAEFHQSKHELIRVSKTNIIQNRALVLQGSSMQELTLSCFFWS
ncbi:hypothetical protein FQA47_015609 [Oryzias melastigma]|uniref:Uncharacterized protein n=1 Tax=Oryzias melastigma TaxID=30732 RepID=A0A834BQI9_ORYME|nr:hypothetical protein FQA47_015609 [Oryzias melastigma]